MPDPVTIGVGVLIALGSAVGGYVAGPRKKSFCDMHESFKTRLASGDDKFKTVLKEISDQGKMLARIDERTIMIEAMVKQQKGRF